MNDEDIITDGLKHDGGMTLKRTETPLKSILRV